MEYIKTSEYNTRIDVYFDGEKYVFINAFYGIAAIARRLGLVEFTADGYMAHVKFSVEKTKKTISNLTIHRVIDKQESKYVSTVVEYETDDSCESESLSYVVSVSLEHR